MDNKCDKKIIISLIQERYYSFEEANILLIDKVENNKIIEKLFPISGYNIIKNIDDEFRIEEGINFFNRELFYEKEEKFLEFIKNNENNIDILIFGLSELATELYNEENNILKKLNEFNFKSFLVLNGSENFSMEELSYHYQYCHNELNIKNFFVTDNINIKNRIINQYEDISNFIYKNINKEFRRSFLLGQTINDTLKNSYLEEEIINIYKEVLLDKKEELKGIPIRDLYEISESIKEEFLKFYNVKENHVEISQIAEGVTENILNNKLTAMNLIKNPIKEMEENIKITDDKDEVIGGFLSKDIDEEYKVEIEDSIDELDKTAIMELDNTAIMDYSLLDDLENDFKNIVSQKESEKEQKKDENESNKRLSIINMSENKTFKEVTISENYGLNEDFTFEEEENFIPLIEMEEIDDKLKEVIWGNDEIAMEDLSEFELVDGSSKKYKKINMNGNSSN